MGDERRPGQDRLAWLGVGGVVLLAAVGIWLLGVPDRAGLPLLLELAVASLVLSLLLWFGDTNRRDRALFVSIALPAVLAVGLGIALAMTGNRSSVPSAVALGWLMAWLLGWNWIKPRWTRVVLRHPQDPADTFRAAWRTFRLSANGHAPREELYAILAAMADAADEQTTPLIDTWYCLLGMGLLSDAQVRADRLYDRQQELLLRYDDDMMSPAHGVWPNPVRPTEGTRLELAFPELEALVAAASPAERHAMAVAASLWACRDAGLDPDTIEAAVAATADDASSEAVLAAAGVSVPSGDDDDGLATWRARLAIASVTWARDDIAWDRDDAEAARQAAGAVYQAARAADDERLRRLTEEIAGLVDPERRAGATEVVVDRALVERSRQRNREARDPANRVIPPAMRLLHVAAIGFVAGAGGTVIRAATWSIYRDALPDPAPQAIAILVGLVAATAIAWVLFAGFGHRLAPARTVELGFAMFVAMGIEIPLREVSDVAIQTLAPGVWESVFAHRTSVMPYAPLYGVAAATVLVAVALYTRRVTGR